MARALGTGRGQAVWGTAEPLRDAGAPWQQRRPNLPEFLEDLGAETSTRLGSWFPCIPLGTAARPLSLRRFFPAWQSVCLAKWPCLSSPRAFLPPGEGEHSPCPSSARGEMRAVVPLAGSGCDARCRWVVGADHPVWLLRVGSEVHRGPGDAFWWAVGMGNWQKSVSGMLAMSPCALGGSWDLAAMGL